MAIIIPRFTDTLRIGPFLSVADGVTPVTGLAGSMTVKLSKQAAAFVDRASVGTITYDTHGFYRVPFDVDFDISSDSLGWLQISVSDPSSHLPVWHEYIVVDESSAIYANMFVGGVSLVVDVYAIKEDNTAADNMKDFFDGTGYAGGTIPLNVEVASLGDDIAVNVTHWNGTAVATPHTAGYPVVTVKDGTGTGEIDTASGKVSVATGGIAAGSFASGAVDAAALATDAVNEIRDAIKNLVVESQGSYTLQGALSVILAALAGVTDDNGATIKTPNGAATRIEATIDSDNDERTAMTLTPSS